MIRIEDKTQCCGCSACVAVCPHSCISIKADSEGFYYPLVDETKCVDCGLCEKKCPIKNKEQGAVHKLDSYVIQNKDVEILKESTSGGAFTAFAKYIINQQGVIVGAALNEQLVVEHIIVKTEADLYKFRNSKYVQSYISPAIFPRIKQLLKAGTMVCFSGTACQVEGLKSYLGNTPTDNLLCIDVVCRAVPSPLIYKKYLEYQSKKNSTPVTGVRFRDKHYGYRFPSVKLSFSNKKIKYHRGIESDPWLRAFFTGICNRPSCYKCVFKEIYRIGDITLWDCFDYEDHFPQMLLNMGATNMLIHTKKGRDIFNKVAELFIVEPVNTDIQLSKIKEMTASTEMHVSRVSFFEDAQTLDGYVLFNKYFPIGFRQKALYYGRLLTLKLGVYRLLKKVIRR